MAWKVKTKTTVSQLFSFILLGIHSLTMNSQEVCFYKSVGID